MTYSLWEILKEIKENKLQVGSKFKAKDIPIELILEYDGSELVYNNIMGNTTTRDIVKLCSGEISTNYVKIEQEDCVC